MTKHQINNCTYMGNSLRACGSATVQGRSYCEDHLWLVYKRGTAVERKKDTRVANDVRLWESLFNEAVEELIGEGVL